MYETLTVEEIKTDILSRMKTDIDTREGSYTNDMVSTVAHEIWKAYQTLDSLIPIVYVDETSGEYIDKKCSDYGIKRKSGTKATVKLTITGTNGVVIPQGKVFLTIEGLEFITDKPVTIADGVAIVTATAVEEGVVYNVAAGTIVNQYINLPGVLTVTNDIATGGNEPETDEALVERLYNYLQQPATSGNVANYKQWAMEVEGVGDVKVFPLWNGPGTVKVTIVDMDKKPVNESRIQKVADYIETVRPIGSNVTVASGISKLISLSATIVLAPGYSSSDVKAELQSNLESYFKSIAFAMTYVSYAKIGNLLLNTEGILDYNNLLINNSNVNIAIADDEVPIISTLSLEV